MRKERARLLSTPDERLSEPVVLWNDVPIAFPLRAELRLHGDEDVPPEAVLLDQEAREIKRFRADLAEMIGEEAEAAVLARAHALQERLERLRSDGAVAIAPFQSDPDKGLPSLSTAPLRSRPAPSRISLPLVEGLLVATLMGMLLSLTLPRLNQAKERAWTMQMQGDLHQLVTQQEVFHEEHESYASSMTELERESGFQPVPEVDIQLLRMEPGAYSAVARHRKSKRQCTVQVTRQSGADIECR